MVAEDIWENIEPVKQLVTEHQVCYEVWPEYLMVQGNKVQVGFSLELCGTHGHERSQPLPGCSQCYQVYEDLRRIADWIKPREKRPSYYEIQPYDRALHQSIRRRFRSEVSLTIRILHRQGFDRPVDECEELCLKEMREKLAELGVLEGRWHSS